jgi:hypothetical protein
MRRLVQSLLLLPLLLVGFPTLPQVAGAQTAQALTFNVTVSLEWQPGADDELHTDLSLSQCNQSASAGVNYLDDLITGLNKASDYLALYSAGQMSLGTVTIYTGGAHWNTANIRVLADSSYRPKAFVGGIVTAPMTYTSPKTQRTQTFYPGAIYLGRLWDGTGARCGPWSMSEGHRTIGHEWAHYALYLYDEYYKQTDLSPVYCTTTHRHLPSIAHDDPAIDKTDSLMAYHYRAGQLWSGGFSDGTCDDTPQMAIHGESDWDTVQRFYPNVVIPSSTVSPASEPITWSIAAVETLPSHSSANVSVFNSVAPGVQLSGQGYIIRTNADTSPQRIIGQGTLIADESIPLPFLGVLDATKDRAVVVMQDPQTGSHFVANSNSAPLLIGQAKQNNLALKRSTWKPCASITPTLTTSSGVSSVTHLTVKLRDCASQTSRIELTYCPSGGSCLPLVAKTIDSNGNFIHTFTFSTTQPPAEYGYIYARSADIGEVKEETVAWYQLAGGVGPATITGHAPMLERTVDTASSSNILTTSKSDSYLLYSGVFPHRAVTTRLPLDVQGIVDTPLDIQPVVSNGQTSIEWNTERYDPKLTIRLSYNQDLLNRLRISEGRLVLLRLDAKGWQAIRPLQRSFELDWLAIEAQAFTGSGATFALGYLKD